MTTYFPGDNVPSGFNPSLVTASYVVSFVGCMATVELLHGKGTALLNWKSWLQIIVCASSMGLVGTWCMHFIGNRAVVLGDGRPELQLVYRAGDTVISLLLPVLGFIIAFSVAEWRPQALWLQLSARAGVGIFAGASIAGMHYLANRGVPNYSLTYRPAFVAASGIIAVGVCWIVLALFYNLREQWLSAAWKRILCAMALAGGVSAMHFAAATHCKYRLIHLAKPSQSRSMDMQDAIAGAFCGIFACGIGCHVWLSRCRDRKQRSKAQKVTLAWICFDGNSGRLAVTWDGILPCREITDHFPDPLDAVSVRGSGRAQDGKLDADFDTSDTTFHWMFRVSRNWEIVSPLVPKMKSHLHAFKRSQGMESEPSTSRSSSMYEEETFSDTIMLFKEKMLVAAASLAASVNWPLEYLGVLADRIYETGTLNNNKTGHDDPKDEQMLTEPREIEAAIRRTFTFGKGKVLFIAKEASDSEVTQLLNCGMRFASLQQVGRTIADAMQIDMPTLETCVSEMKRYTESLHVVNKIGTWLAFFAMIPKPHGKGFDIVVKKDHRDQLPDVHLLATQPEDWHQRLFDRLDGEKVPQVLQLLDDRTGKLGTLLSRDVQFTDMLRQAILQLTAPVPPEWVKEARF